MDQKNIENLNRLCYDNNNHRSGQKKSSQEALSSFSCFARHSIL